MSKQGRRENRRARVERKSQEAATIAGVPMPERIARLPRDQRGYPILATVARRRTGVATFSIIDEHRRFILGVFDWCGVCGLPFQSGDLRCTVLADDEAGDNEVYVTEPPVHEICALYSMQICPYLLTSGATIRRGPASGTVRGPMALAGYATTSALLASTNGPVFVLSELRATSPLDDVAESYATMLAHDITPTLSPFGAQLLSTFEAADPPKELWIAALAAAAFSPDVVVSDPWGPCRQQSAFIAGGADNDLAEACGPLADQVLTERRWSRELGDALPFFMAVSEAGLREYVAEFGYLSPD